jgi:hypothetical protein
VYTLIIRSRTASPGAPGVIEAHLDLPRLTAAHHAQANGVSGPRERVWQGSSIFDRLAGHAEQHVTDQQTCAGSGTAGGYASDNETHFLPGWFP